MAAMKVLFVNRLVLVLVLALPAACAGGGGGGSGGGSRPASFFETTEYFASSGLETIDASVAYATGATGRGVTVAVIDTGVDRDHPELEGRVLQSSIDIVSGTSEFVDDIDGHGTAVAGIVAARRNGQLSHGVAFGASILAIRADALDSCASGCSFTQGDVAAATDYAVDRGARVINYSLGGAASVGTPLGNALQSAAEADTLLVFAAGNGGGSEPGFPARVAGEPALRERALVVGSVDGDGDISSFSDRAGDLADIYLLAPGERVLAPGAGGGAVLVSGTSFAAPHVSGAAAVLLDAAPFLSASEVADLLLSTAADLGEPGADPVYGRGLLDLGRALQPQGALLVPTGASVDGGSSLEGSGLDLGAAFGPIADLAPIVFLDGYGRPYWTGVDERVNRRSERFALDRWFSAGGRSAVTFQAAPAVAWRLSLDAPFDGWLASTDAAPGPWRRDRGIQTGGLAVGESTRLDLVTGGAALASTALADAWTSEAAAAFMSGGRFAPPHGALLGESDAVAFRHTLGDLGLGVALAEGEGPENGPGADHLAAVQIDFRPGGGRSVSVQAGRLDEQGGPLDSFGRGAFRTGAASTSFVALGGRWPLQAGTTLFGQVGVGRTTVADGGGLIRDFSMLTSIGAALGAAREAVLRPGDRLMIGIAQPLRVEAGGAVFDRPVGRSVDGVVQRERTSLDLEPEGREVDLELGYRTHLPAVGDLALNWLVRLEPEHDPDAAPDHVVALRLRRAW